MKRQFGLLLFAMLVVGCADSGSNGTADPPVTVSQLNPTNQALVNLTSKVDGLEKTVETNRVDTQAGFYNLNTSVQTLNTQQLQLQQTVVGNKQKDDERHVALNKRVDEIAEKGERLRGSLVAAGVVAPDPGAPGAPGAAAPPPPPQWVPPTGPSVPILTPPAGTGNAYVAQIRAELGKVVDKRAYVQGVYNYLQSLGDGRAAGLNASLRNLTAEIEGLQSLLQQVELRQHKDVDDEERKKMREAIERMEKTLKGLQTTPAYMPLAPVSAHHSQGYGVVPVRYAPAVPTYPPNGSAYYPPQAYGRYDPFLGPRGGYKQADGSIVFVR